MILTFSPVRYDTILSLQREGDVLTLNGEAFDFGPLPDGATLPRDAIVCDWIAGDVRREGGMLMVPLLLPHGPDAPEATRFPQPIVLAADGPVTLPAYGIVAEVSHAED